jgi:predicted O-methyltransferase YrrM
MIADEYAVRCREWSDIVDHLPRLHAEAAIGGCLVIELGVRSGNSTAAFLAAVAAWGGHVWSVDVNAPQVPPEWFASDQWSVLVGDDLALAHLLPPVVDVLFIDTSHQYGQTVAELAAYVPKVKPGGVVLLHDTELERPEAGLPDDPPFPVRQAVDEFCAAHGLTPEYVPGCNGLGVIRIPGGAV